MKLYFIAILATISLAFTSHNTPMAFFDMTILDQSIELQMEFEQAALEQAIETEYTRAVSDELIEKYLLEHTQWVINGIESPLSIQSIKNERGHFNISARLDKIAEVKTLRISNTCLLHVEGHHNIIRLSYGDKLREFGLSKERTWTEIAL